MSGAVTLNKKKKMNQSAHTWLSLTASPAALQIYFAYQLNQLHCSLMYPVDGHNHVQSRYPISCLWAGSFPANIHPESLLG